MVFDEDFVRAAVFHEPTAVERLLAAAEARAEAEAARAGPGGRTARRRATTHGYGPGRARPTVGDYPRRRRRCDDPDGPYGPLRRRLRPYRGSARWHRPVAWVLALVMGIGMVALAFTRRLPGRLGRPQTGTGAHASGVDARHGRSGQRPHGATACRPSADYARRRRLGVPRSPDAVQPAADPA